MNIQVNTKLQNLTERKIYFVLLSTTISNDDVINISN